MYMPTHLEDTYFIPHLKNKITNQITIHLNHIYALCDDFNRDIALRGKQFNNTNTLQQEENYQWKKSTTSLNLEYIPTKSNISRERGYNYTSTSPIDGLYIHSSNNNKFILTTNTNMNLNSDHYPVVLHISHNTLIARIPPLTNTSPTRILKSIPLENSKKFNITFFAENSVQIKAHTTLLENHQHLSLDQWIEACTTLDYIVNKISKTIVKTCKIEPIPNITTRWFFAT